jgi:surface protein
VILGHIVGLRYSMSLINLIPLESFYFTWKTDNAGSSNNDQATLPFTISASLDCIVDWDDPDGSTTVLNSSSSVGDLTHTYSDGVGTKNISISGTGINRFAFTNGGDKLKILEVINCGNLDITQARTFLGCSNLTWTAKDAPIISTTDLTETFRGCVNFNGKINNWDVSSVSSIANMFHLASSFNQPLNNWNTSSITNMDNVFRQASVFNQPLGNWNTSSVTSMQLTFYLTVSFDQDISSWDVNQVTLFNLFHSGELSRSNYDALLIAWDSQGVMSFSGTVPFGSSKYTLGGLAESSRSSLVTKWGGITDGGGIVNENFDFTWKTDNVGTSNDDQATLPIIISADLDCIVDWGDDDGSTTTLNSASSAGDLTHTYSGGLGTKSISISGTGINGFKFNDGGDKLKILEVSNVGNLDITERETFFGCTNLTWTATAAPNITATDLTSTFDNCTNFNGNINNWDVSNVQTMFAFFENAISFNQPLNNWNTSSFVYATSLFRGATSFNQPLNNWDVSSVTGMLLMFQNATSFDQDISSWDINQVTNLNLFMSGVTLSTTNYDLLLVGWAGQGAMSYSGTTPFGSSKYTLGGLAESSRSSLVTEWGGVTDGGGIVNENLLQEDNSFLLQENNDKIIL